MIGPGLAVAWAAIKKFAAAVPVKVWLGLLAAVLIFVFLAKVYYSGKNAGKEECAAKIAGLESSLVMARADNESNQDAIARLVQANLELAEGRAVDQEAAATAVAKVEQERDALAADLEKRRKTRGEIYERDPTADAWGRVPVHPDILRGLLSEM